MVHCYFHKHKQASILSSCRSYFTLLIRHLLLWTYTHTHTHMLAVSRRAENAHWNTNDHREINICRYIDTKTCICTLRNPTNTCRRNFIDDMKWYFCLFSNCIFLIMLWICFFFLIFWPFKSKYHNWIFRGRLLMKSILSFATRFFFQSVTYFWLKQDIEWEKWELIG